jgi:DNA-binding SARP family transcriptional activator/tetratricopeptide (TPR) repeat protein
MSTACRLLGDRCRYVSITLPSNRQVTEGTRIQLCGRLSVEIGGAQLANALRGRQVPLLLAYLLLNRDRYVGREELIGALWPFHAPRSQDAALRTLLSRLRSALGSEALAGREELILTMPEPVWIDIEAAVLEVQRAQQTLDRGDLRSAWALAQVPLNIAGRGLLPGTQATWLESRRRELEDVRLRALEVIGRAGLLMGGTQLASAERAARGVIEVEPYRESGYALLMEVLALQGNVAEGLRVYDRLRTLLRDELGTTPSAETIAVHERLLRPQPPTGALGAGAAGAPGAPVEPPGVAAVELPPELAAQTEVPLVGRRRELSELARRWAIARGDLRSERSGRIVVLAGDPGIGKTRLAAELARNAYDQGACVLVGRAPEETLVPYQLFVEALRHYLLNAPAAELQVTAREYGSELARLIPELRRRAPDLPPAPAAQPETDRYRMFEAVVGLLSAISSRTPVLLVLDDLQWADRPTLLLLRHLARAPDPSRLLILGAYRSTESAHEGFVQTLADLRRERLISQIDVDGLIDRETSELVRILTGEAPSRALTRALHDETEGNPLFVSEIVRNLVEAGVRVSESGAGELQRFSLPEGVKQVIARRVARLSAQGTEWLRVASVIGRDFDVELLERVVSLDEEEFLNALDEVLAAGVVVETVPNAGRYAFAHALIRDTLYERMSAPRRARIHRRVGEELEASAAGERYLNALAYHFTRAAATEDGDKAITYARRAGEQATAVLSHEEAAEHYSRALEVLERSDAGALDRRCELLLLLGEARVRAGERAAAWPTFREAAELAERLGDSASLARAAIGASRRYVQQPGVVEPELIAMLKRALEATAGERTVMHVRLLARLCGAIYFSPERDRMRALSDQAMELARELDDPEALTYAWAARRRALWDAAHLPERIEASTEMLTRARQGGGLELELQAHAWLAVDLLEQGDRDAVDAQMEAFAAGAERVRQPLFVWNATLWLAMRALLAGDLGRAEELAADALAAGGPSEAVTAHEYFAVQLLAIRREQAKMASLEASSRQLVQRHPSRPAWRVGLALLLWETDRSDEARQQIDAVAEQGFDEITPDGDWLTTSALLAEVCASLGDVERSALLYDRLLPYGERNVVVGLAAICLGSVATFLGKLAATIGRDREAAEHFEHALVANEALRAPVCVARTQLDYARALGPGQRARELVESASLTAARLGLQDVARRAAALAREEGGLPRTLPSPGP